MKINLKARLKNPVFWVQIIGAFLLSALAYNNMQPQDLTTWAGLGALLMGVFKNPFLLGTCLWNVWSAINDPTTSGIGDSNLALTYSSPKKNK